MPRQRWLLLAVPFAIFAAFSVRPALAQATNVTVSSSVYTNETGIMVKAGQQVKITATGTVNIADENGPYITDPNGTIVTAPPDGSGAFDFFENDASPEGEPPVAGEQKSIVSGGQLNGQPYGAIVAAILPNGGGDLTAFTLIGSAGTYKVPVDGTLCLSVNDINNTVDNQGSYVAIVSTLTASIASVEFTQAIQEYQTLDDLKATLADNGEPPVPIIEGKLAAARIYFNSVTDATDVVITLTGDAEGSKTISLQPDCDPEDQRSNTDGCQSADFFFVPIGNSTTTTITVSDTAGNQLEQETLTSNVRTTSGIQLKALGACAEGARFTNGLLCGKAPAMAPQMSLLPLLMPTSQILPVYSPDRIGIPLPTTFKNLTQSQIFGVWTDNLSKLANSKFSIKDQIADDANNTYTDYAGIYDANVGDSSAIAANIPAHGLLVADSAVIIGYNSTASMILAHEIGHTLNLHHTNRAQPHVSTYPGCFGLAEDPGTYWPFPDNLIQSSTGVYEFGYNTDAHSVVSANVDPPTKTFDVMSYCLPVWVSPLDYDRMIETLGGGTVENSDARIGVTKGRIAAPASRPKPAVAPPTLDTGLFWQISGSIDPVNGLAFDPVFEQTVDGTTDPGSGTYSIEVLDATSQVLYTRLFTPLTATNDGDDGTTTLSNPYFFQWIPVTAGAASVVVLDPTSTVIGTVPVTGPAPGARVHRAGAVGGGGAPVVTITSPTPGFVGSGVQTISWTAQEAGITTFSSRLLYSPDGGTTWHEQGDTPNTSEAIDFDQLPGSTNALIQVLVSDGVNTGSATSASFTVPKHPPSSVLIANPPDGYAQPAADPITLRGFAFDADDGFLSGTALDWSSDIQGDLGTGSPLFVKLNPGTHNITLTGTDSDGNAISTSVSVTIGGGRPIVSLTTSSLSTDCSSVTLNATPGAQGAPLSLVQYSLDGGVTYTNLALNQLPFTVGVPGSGIVIVVVRAYDTSNQSAAQSAEIPIPAACTAGVPVVSAGSHQAQVVGGAFATPLTVVIKDAGGNPIQGATVTFSAPSSGASAVLSASSATTNASGIASVTATANGTNGNYTVTASVAGFSTVAQFSLTNTDFTVAVNTPSPSVKKGQTVEETITITPLSGFNSTVTFACSGLPDGVTCVFATPTVTPTNGTATDGLTIIIARNTRDPQSASLAPVFGTGAFFALCLAGVVISAGGRRRQKMFRFVALIAVTGILVAMSACAGRGFTPFTANITVTATSGGLTHSTPIAVFIK